VVTPLVLTVLLGAMLVPMSGLVEGTRWVLAYLAGALGVLMLGVFLRAIQLRPWMTALVQLLVGPVVAAYLAVRPTLSYAVWPGDKTWQLLDTLGSDVAWTVEHEQAPVTAVLGLVVLALAGGGVLAAVMDWYTHTVGAPAATALVAALPVVLAVAFVRQPLPEWRLVVPIAAYLLVLWLVPAGVGRASDDRSPAYGQRQIRRPGLWVGWLVVLVTVAGGLGLAGLVPNFSATALINLRQSVGGDGGGDHSPLMELGRDLRQRSNRVVAYYETDLPGGVYLRLSTVSRFDGTTWLPDESGMTVDLPAQWAYGDLMWRCPAIDPTQPGFDPTQDATCEPMLQGEEVEEGYIVVGPGGPGSLEVWTVDPDQVLTADPDEDPSAVQYYLVLPDGWDRDTTLHVLPNDHPVNAVTEPIEHTAQIELVGLRGEALPLPWVSQRITGLDQMLQLSTSDLAVRSPYTSVEGAVFQVTFALPDLAADRPNPALPSSEYLASFLEVGDDLPPIIADTALAVVAGATDPLARARALEAYFTSGEFTYSTSAPVQQGYDGDSAAVITRFLEVKEGYCVHFSAAMALMARQVGLPSRVVLGYLPGTVETPPEPGELPRYTVRAHQLHSWPEIFIANVGWVPFEPTPAGPGSTIPSPTPSPTPSPSPRPTASPGVSPSPTPTRSPNQTTATTNLGFQPWQWVGGGLLVLVLALAPALAGWFVRGRRLRGGLDGAWRLVQDTARELGQDGPAGETPRDFGDRLAGAWGTGPPVQAIEGLIDQVELAAYAPPVSHGGPEKPVEPPNRDQVRLVLRQLRSKAPHRTRLRVWLWPSNHFRRV